MPKKLKQVMVAVPAYDGKVVCDFSVGIAEIFRLAKQNGYELFLNYWMYDSLIHIARNSLFTTAHEQGVDELVFIDADQGFSSEAFFGALNHPVDVVGVPVRNKEDEAKFNIRPHEAKKHKYNIKLGLLEVEAIGTGFLRLSKAAIQILRDASPAYGDNHRMICNTQIINGGLIGEDIQICDKLRAAGLKVYVDINHTCDHFGTKRWSGSYKDYYIAGLKE
tara:strand:+ start:103 stop:765 length:663 start_codon:yes stop_codon:yes gene_type:complete